MSDKYDHLILNNLSQLANQTNESEVAHTIALW